MSNLLVKDGAGADKYIKKTGVGTDADPHFDLNGEVSSVNSTAVLLTGAATFTGTWIDVSNFSTASLSIIASVGVDVTLYFDVSHDGGITFTSIPRTVADTSFDVPHTFTIAEQWLRIRITNGTTAMSGTWSTQTMLFINRPIALSSVPEDAINNSTQCTNIRPASDFNQDRNEGFVSFETSERVFGKNEAVSTSFEPIWTNSGAFVFPTTDEGFRVKAGGNAADTSGGAGARTVEIKFLNTSWVEVTETLTLAGASASASTSVSGWRVNSVKVLTSGTYHASNTGVIVIENDAANQVVAQIEVGEGVAEQVIYTVPATKTMWIKDIEVSVGQADSCDIALYHVIDADDMSAPFTSVKLTEWQIEDFAGIYDDKMETYLKYPAKTDVWMEAKRVTGAGSAKVSAKIDFVLHN